MEDFEKSGTFYPGKRLDLDAERVRREFLLARR